MSRKTEDLHPDVYLKCLRFLALCQERGIPVLVTQTYRTPEEQNQLYSLGRTIPGRIVTNAPSGYSWHEFGRAFDIVLLRGPNQITYVGPWDQVGDIGESVGLEWGGRWKKPDRPHFEDRGGLTLAQARAQGYVPEP